MLVDKMRKTCKTMLRAYGKTQKYYVPDLRYDVDSVANYLTLKLGSTKEEVTAPSKRNKMSGGDMTLEDCAFSQVMKAKGKLREWITNIVTSGDLFERVRT